MNIPEKSDATVCLSNIICLYPFFAVAAQPSDSLNLHGKAGTTFFEHGSTPLPIGLLAFGHDGHCLISKYLVER